MTPEQVADIAHNTIITLLWVSMPLMLIALVVGLAISLLQALTSIQENTLTFVPKIFVLLIALMLLLPWMADKMGVYTRDIFHQIAGTDAPPPTP